MTGVESSEVAVPSVSSAADAQSTEPAARRRGPSAVTVLSIASLGAAVAFLDATVVNIAFPNIEKSFPTEPITSLSWILNAYNIVFAAFLVAAGRFADLIGRRRMFIFGMALFTVASVLCSVAPSVGVLVAFRVIQALGSACLVPASLALVLNAFPPDRRSYGVTLLSAVAAAAAGLGPTLGGLLVSAANWRLVFLVNLPIGVIAVLLARRFLVESRAAGRRRMPDMLGAAIFAVAIAALVLAVVRGEDWGWEDPRIIASFAVAVVLGAVFVRRCRWHRSPIVDLKLFRSRTFSASNAATVMLAAGYYGYTLVEVLFLTGVWHYTVLQAGLALIPGPFVAAAASEPSGRLVERIGPRPVLVCGSILWGGAVIWFITQAGSTPAFFSVWLPGVVMLGAGAGAAFPNLSAVAVASAPGDSFATATAMNSVARQVGAALGVAVVVAIIGTPTLFGFEAAFKDAWKFCSAILIAAGFVCLLIGRLRSELAPSLGDAARVVLRRDTLRDAVAAPVRRARRAIVVDLAHHGPPRAESAAEFLAHAPVFAGLEPELLEALASKTSSIRVPAGSYLFHEGDPGDAMFVVRAGRLEVLDESSGTVIRQLGRGDGFGELAVLTASERSAAVRAARTSDVLAIAKADFEALLHDSPALSLGLTRALSEQLRDTRAPVDTRRPRPTTVALVALGDRIDLAKLASGLTRALSEYLSPVLLNGAEVAAPDRGAEPATIYGPLLDRAEGSHDLVLLQGGSTLAGKPWTEFCLQQADRILAVTSGGPVPARLGELPELRGCDLLCLDVAQGSGKLSGWADALDPVESHVVRRASFDQDLERAARRLSGNSLGVVLSGGGARAFAHIGAIEELLAAGLKIDRIAGVSMGAMIGALFALGLDPDEVDALCFEEWVQKRPLADYALPRHSLIRGDRMRAMLDRMFDGLLVEELPRSFISGYAELRSGRFKIARHGNLWEAVGYSMSLPILVPPVVRGRELYIDGSLVDNLPVKAMADLAEGPIVAVDVKATLKRPGEDPRPDGTALDIAGANGADPADAVARLPGLGETMMRVLLLGSANTSEAARRHADLVINPLTEGVGLLEFHQLDTAREAGRAAAREALEQVAGRL